MAISSPDKVLDLAKDIVIASQALKVAKFLIDQVASNNSVNDPGWSALQTTPDASVMDVTTKILTGTRVTPGEIASAIGALNVFLNYWNGDVAVAQSAWGQDIEKVSAALINTNAHNFKDTI